MPEDTGRRVLIRADDVTIDGELNDSPTADLVWEALTIKAIANTCGDEVYFAIHVSAQEDDTAQETVRSWRYSVLAAGECAVPVLRADADVAG